MEKQIINKGRETWVLCGVDIERYSDGVLLLSDLCDFQNTGSFYKFK
jgi:hypothetical protein